MKYNPEMDGIDHINIYSRSRIKLGRELSHFANMPINIPEHGAFSSVEGYWYWLSCHRDELRELHGLEAKKVGRELRRANRQLPDTHPDKKFAINENFNELIMAANRIKIDTYPDLKHQLVSSSLPLVHYYVVTKNGKRVSQEMDHGSWIWEDISRYRSELKGQPEEKIKKTYDIEKETEGDQFSLF